MIAYVLCAGFGTRMRPLTKETPKSLLSVGGRPLLDLLMADLRNWQALDAVHLAVNDRDADAFRTWAESRRAHSDETAPSLHVHNDGVRTPDDQLGAVGDLAFLLTQTGRPDDGALVTGGDSLYRFPLAPVLNAFDGRRSWILALHEPDRHQRRQSSTLQLDGPRVGGLVEDPDEADSTRICPSWYLLTPDALGEVSPYLRSDGDPDTLGAFLHVLAQKLSVEAVRLPERPHLRLHCNTPEDLRNARALLKNAPRDLLDPATVRQCLPDRVA